jgi:hypothetical protein
MPRGASARQHVQNVQLGAAGLGAGSQLSSHHAGTAKACARPGPRPCPPPHTPGGALVKAAQTKHPYTPTHLRRLTGSCVWKQKMTPMKIVPLYIAPATFSTPADVNWVARWVNVVVVEVVVVVVCVWGGGGGGTRVGEGAWG